MTTNFTYLSFCLTLILPVKCVHVLFQPFPFPIISFITNFFFFSKKIYNALWKIAHNGKNYFLPLSQAQASYFIFHGDMLWIIPWFWKYISLHPPGYMRRTWHWTEAGYIETNQLYHTTNHISLYFWYIEIYHMKSCVWYKMRMETYNKRRQS